ncbi:MAG: hypothetical protein K8T89_05805, partial [Planctomycetes bacterium]|nr:hypothetical protein [Planctomycetota bacterium]
WRGYWFSGNFARVKAVWDDNRQIWSTIAGLYLCLVVFLICLFMYWRRKVTVVYNVDPGTLDEHLVAAIESLKLGWQRALGGLEIGTRKKRPMILDDADKNDTDRSVLSGETAFVRFDIFPAMRHATLRWEEEGFLLRSAVEEELDRLLAVSPCAPNPVGSWFMTAAIASFFLMLLWLGFLVYTVVAAPRGF